MRAHLLITAVAICSSLVGCSKRDRVSPTTLAGAIEAWDDAGLDAGAFEPADDLKVAGGACQRGTVEGLEAVVCEYSSVDAADRAREAGLRVVGSATGLAVASGPLLLVATDREGADPSGKAINRVTQVFRGQP